VKQETQDWLDIAEQDIGSATSLLKAGFVENAAYFCQQSIEKILKAILTETNVSCPKTHDLSELADLAILDLSEDQRVLLNRLTDHAFRSRYPGARYNRPDVERLVDETENLYQWLRQRLN
jgi:HEPN domain-containing protein